MGSEKGMSRRALLMLSGGCIAGFSATVFGIPVLLEKYGDRTHGEYKSFSHHPVDQVFRDHDGYRVRWVAEDDISEEIKYSDAPIRSNIRGVSGGIEGMPSDIADKFRCIDTRGRHRKVVLIHDLGEGKRGYANVVHYDQIILADRDVTENIYAEIHLSRNQGISPGNDLSNLVTRTPMHEIK